MTKLTHEGLRYLVDYPDWETDPSIVAILARIARAAIAADAMDPNPRTAQAMALRDLLIVEGLRK